jgi:hypothetical protein
LSDFAGARIQSPPHVARVHDRTCKAWRADIRRGRVGRRQEAGGGNLGSGRINHGADANRGRASRVAERVSGQGRRGL